MIIQSNSQIDQVLEFISNNNLLAFDNETTGLNVRKDTIIGFGISNATEGFYVAHKEHVNGELETLVGNDHCIQILEAIKAKRLLMFNGSFDSRFTLNYFGVNLIDSLYSEVMLLKHSLDEERPFRLKDIAKKLFGVDSTTEQQEMKESIKVNGGSANEYFKCDLDIMAKYCIKDCILTYKIYDHYLPKLSKENLFSFYFEDEVMPLYKEVTIPMEHNGVPVNLELLKETKSLIEVDIENLERSIQQEIEPLLDNFKKWYLWKEYSPSKSPALFKQALCEYAELDLPLTASGKFSITKKTLEALVDSQFKRYLLGETVLPDDLINKIQLKMFKDSDEKYMFNLSSKGHLKRLFFDKLEETPISKTEKGSPQVDYLFLVEMEKKYDWVKKLSNLNKLNKLNGTYISGILEKQEEGVFYPSYFQHRTISGRFGSNLQQLPRPKEDGELDPIVLKYNNVIRKFFIAGDGYKFLDADYESLEPHIFSHVSGDEGLKDIFRKGHDFYSTIAIATEGLVDVSADKKAKNYLGKLNPSIRQKAKSYCLGVPYGMESFALSKQLDIPQREAELLIQSYLESYPKLKEWMDISFDECVTRGWVESEAGRIRHMPTAPKIWHSHGKDILDSLKLWKLYNEAPRKYSSMKYLRKQLKNYINNSRNFKIQSLAASITNRACIAIARELKRKEIDGYICAQTHDQIIVRIENSNAQKFSNSMQWLMENTYKISLDLKAPVEIAKDFYEGH